MIRSGVVLGLARAEARLTRRLVRYWVFQSIALILGVVMVLYYGFLHRMFSSWSGTAALLNPRYLVAFIGIYYLVGFLLGLVFLGYDVRARDKRERIVEVVDSLPFTNLELMIGRFLGILIPSWLPVIVICVVLWGVAKLMGDGLAVTSLVTFAFFLAVPAYCFVLGLTFLLTILLRHRLLAAVTLIAVIVGLIVVNFGFVPVFVLPLVDLTGGFSAPPTSDLTPAVIDLRGFLQRMVYLFAGLSMLWFSAAVHPRKDDSSRVTTAAVGAAMLVLALGLAGYLVNQGRYALERKATWKAAHETLRDEPSPDIQTISGNVHLDPGRSMAMDLQMELAAPPEDALERALFTLNPGMEVDSVTSADGTALTVERHDGLADVRLDRPLPAGESTTLQWKIHGRPNIWFAYLDAAFDPLDISIREGNVFILGFKASIFTRGYTVLLPGIRWLPTSGADVGRGDPHGRPEDFFDVDLTVEVPDDLLVAGPGKRTPADGAPAGWSRFRFAPPAPMPGVALVAGHMESRSTEIDGVTLEILVHPSHTRNLEFFEDASGEIRDWLSERLTEATEVGLDYPYDGLTLVEVPAELRGYAGGWRMDTTFTQPAMVFMREAGFPTARFDVPFKNPEEFRDREGGIQRAKLERLELFFENDFSGGNPFVAAARSFFSYQTAGRGSFALPMDFVCEDLSTRLVAEKQGYFSIHHYGRDMGTTINQTIGAMFQNQGSKVSDALIDTVTSRSDVWDEVLKVSLEDLDPWDQPKLALDVLTLKGGAMARSMLDDLGHETTGHVLAALRDDNSGETFSREDVLTAGEEAGIDLSSWLDVWIDETALPGFTVGKVSYERISDSEDGAPRYQLLLTLSNGEPTPGLLRLEYRAGEPQPGRNAPETGQPVRVPGNGAVEIGLVTAEPLRMVRIVPYLALNRIPFGVDLPALDEQTIVDAEPFVGSREVDWTPPPQVGIVVDDLDPGFSVEEVESRSWFRFGGRGARDEDTDQGLPVAQFGRPPSHWSRRSYPTAFGKYRHTLAQVRAGKGERRAIFSADIPKAGPWALEYYLPAASGGPGGLGRGRRGTWSLTIVDPSGSHEVTFDADGAEPGWNTLGTFEIADGETQVVISDRSEGGRVVLADAIRWTPERPEAEGVARR